MKKFSWLFAICFCILPLSITGCGGHDAQVVEAPEEVEDDSAMEGIDDDEYNQAMQESMQPGN